MFVFSLEGLKLRDIDKGVMGRRHSFALFHVSGKNVYRDMKQVRHYHNYYGVTFNES